MIVWKATCAFARVGLREHNHSRQICTWLLICRNTSTKYGITCQKPLTNKFSFARYIPSNKFSFARTFPSNKFLFAGILSLNKFLNDTFFSLSGNEIVFLRDNGLHKEATEYQCQHHLASSDYNCSDTALFLIYAQVLDFNWSNRCFKNKFSRVCVSVRVGWIICFGGT